MRSSTLLLLFALSESALAHTQSKASTSNTSWTSLGCYTGISGENRVSHDRMTVERCFSHCDGYSYAVLSGGRECVCASDMGRKVDAGRCAVRCVGDSGVVCGGWSAGSVYKRESVCGETVFVTGKPVTVTVTETRGSTVTLGRTVTVGSTVTVGRTVTVASVSTAPASTVTVMVPTTVTLPEQVVTVTVPALPTTVTISEQAVTITVSAPPTTITVTAHETTTVAGSEVFTTSTIIGDTTAPYANTTVTQSAIYTNATTISLLQTPTPSIGSEGNVTLTSGSATTASSTVTFNNATLSTTSESVPMISSTATFNNSTLPTTSSVALESAIYNTTIPTTPTSESTITASSSATESPTETSESTSTTSSSTTESLPTPTTPACIPEVSPLANGGFDTGSLAPWTGVNDGPEVYAIGGANHNGAYHATFRQFPSSKAGTATLTQQINVCPGVKYEITAWSQYSSKPNYCTHTVIVDGVALGVLAPGYNQYVLNTFPFTAGGEAAVVQIKMVCTMNTAQWILLDDVAVTLVNDVVVPA